MKQFTTLRILALALMMLATNAGDGSDTQSDGTDCPATDTQGTDCPATDTQGTDTPATATHDTQCTEGTATQDTQGTEGCMTQDTQSCDQSCSYQGPQVNGGFWDGPTGSDSNPCCIEYRMGPFVYVDPIFDPISFTNGGYVPPTPAMPYRSAASSSGYMPPSAASSAQPNWDEQEWICQNIQKQGSPCGFPNSPLYNPSMCGLCNALRPVSETPVAPPMLSSVDPLTIQSAPVHDGAERTGTCCVCMDRVNDVVLLGAKDRQGQYKCRHQCICRQCAAHMRGLRPQDRRCPMCRVPTQFYVVADTVPGGVRTYRD